MVCTRVAFHENDGNHENDENDENDEDDSDSYKQGVECWMRGNHGNHGNHENHGKPGCKLQVPQTTGLEIPDQCLALCLNIVSTKARLLSTTSPFTDLICLYLFLIAPSFPGLLVIQKKRKTLKNTTDVRRLRTLTDIIL